ncbi:eotaxin-like [Phyllopteryx taeniolatus]|uniref:eotaxin-like n=1 Tax=Phyllopteryx taeniolatus TaxID=161469 RepID=UPI002AD57813|nr:eotaxin-like [Phyllopteryx taeniolatus]
MRLNLILLCLTLWMTLVLTTHGPGSNCCPRLSNTRVALRKIKSYAIQTVSACSFKAIVFYTHGRKRICADPNMRWTEKAKLKVDRGVSQQKEQSKDKSASGGVAVAPCTTLRTSQGNKKGKKRV